MCQDVCGFWFPGGSCNHKPPPQGMAVYFSEGGSFLCLGVQLYLIKGRVFSCCDYYFCYYYYSYYYQAQEPLFLKITEKTGNLALFSQNTDCPLVKIQSIAISLWDYRLENIFFSFKMTLLYCWEIYFIYLFIFLLLGD